MPVFDAGAFIAAERGDRAMWVRIKMALDHAVSIVTSTAVIAQIWRGHPRQASLARLVKAVEAVPLDRSTALAAGRLLARSGTADVVDATLALTAGDDDLIYTSDPHDIARLVENLGVSARVIPV
jgi:predicted nucleic acid-binding protein